MAPLRVRAELARGHVFDHAQAMWRDSAAGRQLTSTVVEPDVGPFANHLNS
jgi:hypothetical protein